MFESSQLHIYYNGGSAFLDAEKLKNIEIVARYEELRVRPAAVIKTRFGLGRVVLSGVHGEVGAEGERGIGTAEDVVQRLEIGEKARHDFARMLVDSI